MFWFLLSNFISSFGDKLLVFAVPVGLGVELNDIRTAVFMWLVPAVAMFLSSKLVNLVHARSGHARRDYALLLIFIAFIEFITCTFCYYFSDNSTITFYLVCAFVFFYAFAKEGVPRIFYNFATYKFFGTDKDFQRAAGYRYTSDIVASLLSGFVAYYLVASSSWRIALVVDSLTFVFFALILLKKGSEYKTANAKKSIPNKKIKEEQVKGLQRSTKNVNIVLLMTPLLFGVNALFLNYLPLIADKVSTIDASIGVLMLAVLKTPGLALGVFYREVREKISTAFFLTVPIILMICFGFLFLFYPFKSIFCMTVILLGIVEGTFWSATDEVISSLSPKNMIEVNGVNLRRLSIFQFVSCIFALIAYSSDNFIFYIVMFFLITLLSLGRVYLQSRY